MADGLNTDTARRTLSIVITADRETHTSRRMIDADGANDANDMNGTTGTNDTNGTTGMIGMTGTFGTIDMKGDKETTALSAMVAESLASASHASYTGNITITTGGQHRRGRTKPAPTVKHTRILHICETMRATMRATSAEE